VSADADTSRCRVVDVLHRTSGRSHLLAAWRAVWHEVRAVAEALISRAIDHAWLLTKLLLDNRSRGGHKRRLIHMV
jgi:hypothetical protein